MFMLTGLLLFLMAALGMILNRSNLIMMLMTLEMMLLSACILLVYASYYVQVMDGWLFTLIILTVAACESAMGLTMMICYYRMTGHMAVKVLNSLKG